MSEPSEDDLREMRDMMQGVIDFPHTCELTAYDLARLFCLGMGDRDDVARSLGDIAVTVRLTSGLPARRTARARWVAHELTRLGHADQAAQFTELAADPSPHTP